MFYTNSPQKYWNNRGESIYNYKLVMRYFLTPEKIVNYQKETVKTWFSNAFI